MTLGAEELWIPATLPRRVRVRIEMLFAGREPLRLSEMLADARLQSLDAFWLFSTALHERGLTRQLRWYACWCAWQVMHLLDERAIGAVQTAQRFARGLADRRELALVEHLAHMECEAYSGSGAYSSAWAVVRNAARPDCSIWDVVTGVAWAEAYIAHAYRLGAGDSAWKVSLDRMRKMMIHLVRRMERLGLLTQQQGSNR